MELKQRVLEWLREQVEENGHNRVYSLSAIASANGCTELDLYDRDTDSGAIYELYQHGDVGMTFDKPYCAFAQGGRMEWS